MAAEDAFKKDKSNHIEEQRKYTIELWLMNNHEYYMGQRE